MSKLFRSFSCSSYLVFIPFVLFCFAQSSRAELIDFDDIVRVPTPDDCFCDHPITNEYASKGLLVSGGYLVDTDSAIAPTVSGTNALLGDNLLVLNFVGQLPKVVEFFISAPFEQSSFLDVYGASGHLYTHQTNGEAGPYTKLPYIENEWVSLHSSAGIKSISISTFFGLRISAQIDSLHYEYAYVPESSGFLMLLMGCVGIAWRRLAANYR